MLAEAIASSWVSQGQPRYPHRPVGRVVGFDRPNEDVAPVQAKVVEYQGLSHLEKIR